MKKFQKVILSAGAVAAMCLSLALAGCNPVYVTGVNQTVTEDGTTVITVTYSDGSSSTLDVNGRDGINGKDGNDLKIEDIYNSYILQTGEDISLAEFIERLNVQYTPETSKTVADCLQSTLKIYTEFVEKDTVNSSDGSIWDKLTGNGGENVVEVYTGSSVIYEIAEDYTYLITNYHVVYDEDAVYEANGYSYLARKIYCYLYGSEDAPVRISNTQINYGSYALKAEFVGGSLSNDLAVLRVRTADLRKLNPDVKPVTFASGYSVGDTAIAIGNADGEGISVTQGIVSVDNEIIAVEIGGRAREYRTLRMDTAIYGGNSGGGLFNVNGELIGITNAGDGDNQNMNFALPVQAVKPMVENIMYYCKSTNQTAGKKMTLGVKVSSRNSHYVYNSVTGKGTIVEEVYFSSTEGIAESLGLQANDVITAITVNGTRNEITRYFNISDIMLTIRAGDRISVSYKRNGLNVERTTSDYTVKTTDLDDIL